MTNTTTFSRSTAMRSVVAMPEGYVPACLSLQLEPRIVHEFRPALEFGVKDLRELLGCGADDLGVG